MLKAQGYVTGQFGKNHFGDRDRHLPTNHGFDEFLGNLYHLNAEEEPENEDYPGDMVLADGKTFHERYGPRGVIHSYADGRIEDTGPLTKKRMETIDEETLAAAIRFIKDANAAGKPFYVWWNGTRMHFRTHVKEELRGISGQDEYGDGMVEHDMHVGQLLALLDELGIAGRRLASALHGSLARQDRSGFGIQRDHASHGLVSDAACGCGRTRHQGAAEERRRTRHRPEVQGAP
jgi:arylsulfatase